MQKKKMRVFAAAGLVAAVVALAAVAQTETVSVADRGTRVDNGGYVQLAYGVSAQRSGR